MAQERPRSPRWPSWSQDGANMERQGRAKMAKLEPRWPKRAPRWSQDGQVGAKMEPTWLQDAKDASTWPPSQNIGPSSASCAHHQKTTTGAGATVPSADICSMSTADISISIRCCITQHQRLALARSRWTQDGDNMVPRWPEMLQHGSKKNSTSPKGASRSGQVGQLGAQVGPTWP